MVGSSALVALAVFAGSNRALVEHLSATDSGTRFRAAYALAHVYDTTSSNESQAVRHAIMSGLPGDQAAAADGVFQRRWPNGRLPDDIADAVFPAVIRRQPSGRPFSMPGVTSVKPLHDPLRMLGHDKARQVMARRPGFEERDYQMWLHQTDPGVQRRAAQDRGEWDRFRLDLMSKPALRPPCLETCLSQLMRAAWLGMEMEPALEIRRPPTAEVDWWTDTMFRLVRAAGGDGAALDTLVSDVGRMSDPNARGALLVWLVDMPPAVEIHAKVRPAVVRAAGDGDPRIRRYAIELLSLRPELHGAPGAEEAFAAALLDRDPDVRVRAACELWDLGAISPSVSAKIAAAARTEPDPVVSHVLALVLARVR